MTPDITDAATRYRNASQADAPSYAANLLHAIKQAVTLTGVYGDCTALLDAMTTEQRALYDAFHAPQSLAVVTLAHIKERQAMAVRFAGSWLQEVE